MSDKERKQRFIKALAEFLVEDQAHKSILLEIGAKEGKQWAKLRGETPLFGYPTVEEAEEQLTEFLS
jgi:hypothetical protein